MNRGPLNSWTLNGPIGGGVVALYLPPFRQALYAHLIAIPELTAIVGPAIYPGALPESHGLLRDGPALIYRIRKYPRGHVLSGSDGTATATVEIEGKLTRHPR